MAEMRTAQLDSGVQRADGPSFQTQKEQAGTGGVRQENDVCRGGRRYLQDGRVF